MTFRSMAKRFFRVVLIALACFLALNVMMWSLYFGVRLATTSYSIDWVVLDDVDYVASRNSWRPHGLEECRPGVSLVFGLPLFQYFHRHYMRI